MILIYYNSISFLSYLSCFLSNTREWLITIGWPKTNGYLVHLSSLQYNDGLKWAQNNARNAPEKNYKYNKEFLKYFLNIYFILFYFILSPWAFPVWVRNGLRRLCMQNVKARVRLKTHQIAAVIINDLNLFNNEITTVTTVELSAR